MHHLNHAAKPLSTRSAIACLAVLLSMVCVAESFGQTTEPVEPRLMMSNIYFHEDHDQPWELRIVGTVTSLPGVFLIIHDARGRITLKHHVPHGRYTADQPLIIPIPKDAYAGDYRMIILGYQEDIRGLHMPLASLPKEVYGGTVFAARNAPPLYFKAPPGVETLSIRSSSGKQQVYEGDQVVLDTGTDGELQGRNWVAPLKVKPDAVYNFRNLNVFYFGSPDGLLLCFDINRWFVPDNKITEIKWWKSTQ